MSELTSLLDHNVENIYPSKESLELKLKNDSRLKIYIGIDPSSPNIHLGNAVALWKLREFQNLGHKIILLIGDFTGTIGDPSGRDVTRKPLSFSEILTNSKKYKEQASKILSFDGKNPAEIRYNSKWLGKLELWDFMKIVSSFTIGQLIERDLFQRRMNEEKPIFLNEFLYPILQGYDSVAMEVDMEVGGTDQTFNMLIGRDLLKRFKGKEKFVLTVPLLPGLDGRKMSKSFKNTVEITDDPNNMVVKLMSLGDSLMSVYFRLCTKLSKEEIQKVELDLKEGIKNPMEIKKLLAKKIGVLYHREEEIEAALKEFERVAQKGEPPKPAVKPLSSKLIQKSAVDILLILGMVKSKSEARRLIEQGGVSINSRKVISTEDKFDIEKGSLVQIGRFKAVLVKIET